ncbi:serine/threonine-protein phosphatase [Phytoactinopolyspora alkaliphila]|uniref:Serine/threonine-protein phosphatase n=1 Tax=Phytoactinopolyspora alkaliphila TaxID=1783498 RepID=A0A6N9YHG3_9ACTN|nr:PP2C family serine/threonine-protein phosphatase [Phytoactinopolyspora alkaliphila]NED94370.1 serine/threonine-protein phosphatase [Phytoactinopolyspora alkaliphila]
MHLRYTARSDVGLSRDGNEDAAIAGPNVLAVADGMGGHAAGEVASHATVDELIRADLDGAPDPVGSLAALFSAANARIRQLVIDAPERNGMGTTATVIVTSGAHLPPGTVAVGHIGDSRAYLLRAGELRQLTRDHTFVQTLVDDKHITPSEARVHPARSVVTKVLQGVEPVEPDLFLVEVEVRDRILICSDGLTDVLTDEVLQETLTSADTVESAADELIRLALDGGGPDNITVVLADVVGLEPADGQVDPAPTYVTGAAAS